MRLLIICFISFLFAWLLHLMIWRFAIPKKHTQALLKIFLSIYFIVLFILFVFFKTMDWFFILHFSFFYIPVFLAYICFYSAIEEDSPSVGLIKLTQFNKQCTIEDYAKIINNDLLIVSRLEAMKRDQFLEHKDGIYTLTKKGRLWGKIFSIASSLFNFTYAG